MINDSQAHTESLQDALNGVSESEREQEKGMKFWRGLVCLLLEAPLSCHCIRWMGPIVLRKWESIRMPSNSSSSSSSSSGTQMS